MGGDLQRAARVGRGDRVGARGEQVLGLARAQFGGRLGAGEVVDPGLELLEPKEWELCCGSAGIYNLTRPGPAAELGARKAEHLLATGAEAIAAANPGCTLQIAAHLQRKGRPLPLVHPMQLLARSIEIAARA